MKNENALDAFANDYLEYACGRFQIIDRWRIKIITANDKGWTTIVPQSIRERLSANYQSQGHPVVLVYNIAEDSNVSEENHRICMRVVGFNTEQVNTLSHYDMLVITNIDHPIPQRQAPPLFPPLVIVIAHMALHFIERILKRKIIPEQENTHNYDDHEATELLRQFVEDSGVEEFAKRYHLA